MLIGIVVIASVAVISSAQLSSRCETAYQDAFNAETCLQANISLVYGNATDQQRAMVCNPGQQCNTLIENVIDECGYTVSHIY